MRRSRAIPLMVLLLCVPAHAWKIQTHRHITIEAQDLIEAHDPDGRYQELYLNNFPASFRIQQGSELEDAGGEIPFFNIPDPGVRFGRHFYNPQSGKGLTIPIGACGFLKPPISLTYRDAVDWGLGDPVAFGTEPDWRNPDFTDDNDRGWRQAIEEYRAGRTDNAYLALGHVVHLIEDMTQPDHVYLKTHCQHEFEEFVNRDAGIQNFILTLAQQPGAISPAPNQGSFTGFMNFTANATLNLVDVPPEELDPDLNDTEVLNEVSPEPLFRVAVSHAAGLMQFFHDVVHSRARIVGGGVSEIHTSTADPPHGPISGCLPPGVVFTPKPIKPHFAPPLFIVRDLGEGKGD